MWRRTYSTISTQDAGSMHACARTGINVSRAPKRMDMQALQMPQTTQSCDKLDNISLMHRTKYMQTKTKARASVRQKHVVLVENGLLCSHIRHARGVGLVRQRRRSSKCRRVAGVAAFGCTWGWCRLLRRSVRGHVNTQVQPQEQQQPHQHIACRCMMPQFSTSHRAFHLAAAGRLCSRHIAPTVSNQLNLVW